MEIKHVWQEGSIKVTWQMLTRYEGYALFEDVKHQTSYVVPMSFIASWLRNSCVGDEVGIHEDCSGDGYC